MADRKTRARWPNPKVADDQPETDISVWEVLNGGNRVAAEIAAGVRGAAEGPANQVSDYLPVARVQGPQASLAEVAKALRDCAADLAAVLPALSPAADARVNAVRERCDGLVEKAKHESERLRTEAAGAYLNGDRKNAYARRRRARKVREAAGAQAAEELLDAQCKEFLPLTGRHFPNETLEVLTKTSIDLYGGAEAVADRMHEWRARSWEAEAAQLTADPTPASPEQFDSQTQQDHALTRTPDPFESKDNREAAYQAAARHLGGKQVAVRCKVSYPDLRKWVRKRALAKGPSRKTARIEGFLLPYMSDTASECAHMPRVS